MNFRHWKHSKTLVISGHFTMPLPKRDLVKKKKKKKKVFILYINYKVGNTKEQTTEAKLSQQWKEICTKHSFTSSLFFSLSFLLFFFFWCVRSSISKELQFQNWRVLLHFSQSLSNISINWTMNQKGKKMRPRWGWLMYRQRPEICVL